MRERVLKGRYRLISPLGKGGGGQVWLARDLDLGLERAVKLLPAGEGLEEARLLASLDYPAIPRVLEWIREEDGVFLVMDYIRGENLEKLWGKGGAGEKQTAAWGIQLCRILEYLHSRRPPVLYLDLKPANVILDPAGFLHLVDFGAAALSSKGGKCYGTPGYAAPEQYGGRPGPESDVYGLGMVLRRLMFSEKADMEERRRRKRGERRASDRQAALWAKTGKLRGRARRQALRRILDKSVQEDRRRRFATAGELRAALEAWEKDKGERRCPGLALLLAGGLLLLTGYGISREAREMLYREALLQGRRAALQGAPEEELHRFYGQAIYWAPGRAQPYLELLDYYERQGEAALGVYLVGEYRRAYPSGLKNGEAEKVEERVRELGLEEGQTGRGMGESRRNSFADRKSEL